MADYGADVAYVHDAGFLDLARQATPFVIGSLADRGIERRPRDRARVRLRASRPQRSRTAGHEVLGIDASRAMIELARSRAPWSAVSGSVPG